MKLKALTNVRPTKDLGTQIILAPTEGQFKVSPNAAKLLSVGSGDYAGVAYDEEAEIGYVFKGSEDGLGAKLASSNKGGGGMLTFSAAAGWSELGGDSDNNTHYDIIETPVSEEDLAGTPFEGATLYPLQLVGKIKKQARKSKGDSDDDSDDDDMPQSSAPEAVTADDFNDL